MNKYRKECDKYLSELNKQLRYYTEFKIVKDSIQKLNPEFSFCTILVAYHGNNRNRSSISKKSFEDNLWTIYGIPVVGEWVKLEDDQNKETWGSHGGRLILDSEGIKYEQTTKPFGFVTEEAYKNASWVEVLEKDGHTKHEYLKLEKCILWSKRYEECESILEENFGQSMEVSVEESFSREDGFEELIKFNFSALCILGTQVEPCFESAMIGRQYELSQFKQEFQLMLDSYKAFNSSSQEEPPSQEIPQQELDDLNINNQKKEDENLSKEIKFSDICEKIKAIISENTYSSNGKKYEKYHVCAIHEDSKFVDVVDREDNYSVYKIPYVATQTEEDLLVSLDFDNKVEKSFIIADKTETVFNIRSELDLVSNDFAAYTLETSKDVQKLRDDFAAISSKYEAAQEEITNLKKHLEVYESEKRQLMEKQHRDTIDNIIESKKDEMGRFSEYLEYCLNDHYKKTIDEVKTELKEIHYNFMQKKLGNKKSFSVIETNVVNSTPEDDSLIARWGEENAKYLK